jgi:hypothetical protein
MTGAVFQLLGFLVLLRVTFFYSLDINSDSSAVAQNYVHACTSWRAIGAGLHSEIDTQSFK